MLTRFVRVQLTIFTVLSIIGILAMVFVYLQAPTLLGIGRFTVTLELPAAGGLYRFGNVTYRGVQVGKVTNVQLVRNGVKATLSLATSPKIPADLVAEVHSVSAVGEQYVDLRPRTTSGPYLHDGSVIARADTKLPPGVGPMLDKVSALVGSIPKDRLRDLLDELFTAFNGAGDDLSSLADSSSKLTGDLNSVADRAGRLIDDSRPLVDSQAESTEAIRRWTRSLAGVTGQLATNDPQIRTLLHTGPGAADEVAHLLDKVKPTLPVLLANLTTIGQVAVTYNASLETLLVVLPPLVAFTQASSPDHNPTGIPLGEFRLGFNDPPPCTVGYLPPSSWRSPADTTTLDTPDGLYCKLPQDSPILVRGIRNTPCMGVPGKRAPTVQECDSDKPYQPIAMREHALGPYPFDPNLASQGILPDARVNNNDHIFGPVEGTPPPAGGAPTPKTPLPGSPEPSPTGAQTPGPAPMPPAVRGDGPPVAPSAFDTNGATPRPSVALTQYDPKTGRYAAPTGQVFQQTDLVAGQPKTWRDLIFERYQP
jgi:phospholipid/cholesterol/gamma-HCH transport system substrate-binding protein